MIQLQDLTEEQRAELRSQTLAEIGSRGGVRAASNMTAEQRSERARKAAAARWGK